MRVPGLIAVSAAWGTFWGVWSALLPGVLARNDLVPAELGPVLTAVPLGAIPAMALVGRAAVGRETTALLLSGLSMAAGVVWLAMADGLAMLGMALFVVGAASGALDVCLNAATARAERSGGRHFQSVHAAFPLAMITAAPLAGLARASGLPPGAVLLACAVLLSLTCLTLLGSPAGDGRGGPDADPSRAGRFGRAWLAGALIGGAGACMLVVENAVEHWSVLLLETEHGAGAALASTAPAVYMAALSLSRLLVSRLTEPSTGTLTLVAAIGGCGGFLYAAVAPSAWLTILGYGVAGLAFGPLMPSLLSLAGSRDPSGYLVSVVSTVSYSAFLISPAAVGTLTRWTALPTALACLALAAALPLLAAAALNRREELAVRTDG